VSQPPLRFGVLGVVESILRSALEGVSLQRALVLGLVALATTLPPAFVVLEAAAIIVVVASVVSLTLFHTLTMAALITQLIVLYRLAREGEPQTRAQPIAVCPPHSSSSRLRTRYRADLKPGS
jgi:hypothetical protein